jgi:tRNA(Ile2) C34 agmatinyltransferase TiaS
MQQISLAPIPNQSFNIVLDSDNYIMTFKSMINFMTVDINRNGVDVVLGMRCVAGSPLIPYRYLEQGNFIITTANEEEPFYTNFGVNQFLFFVTQLELEAIRATV